MSRKLQANSSFPLSFPGRSGTVEDDEQDGGPVGYGTEKDEDVPDGMVVAAIVAGEEVGAGRVHDALGENQEDGGEGEAVVNGLGNEDAAPTHQQIKGQREAWIAAHGHNLVHATA